MISAIDQGLIYALLALGVFLTYRILNFADLTVDGSFASGGGAAAILIFNGLNPYLATAAGFAAGAAAGLVTGLLHTKLKIDALLASILTMIALYSVNLRIMAGPNVGLNLKGGQTIQTVFTPLREAGLLSSWETLAILAGVALAFAGGIVWFLSTNFGLAVQATGDNPNMALACGISTDWAKLATLMLANGLVGLSGALYAQFQGFADVQMGIGLILVGLASVIVGNAILGTRYMALAALGVVVGSIVYRLVLFFAIDWDLAEAGDMKLISAVMVVIALVFSQNPKLRGALSQLSPLRLRWLVLAALPRGSKLGRLWPLRSRRLVLAALPRGSKLGRLWPFRWQAAPEPPTDPALAAAPGESPTPSDPADSFPPAQEVTGA
ncbi:MAG: ABC transporter permease [Bifidobacteriaceae bacterium]|nr:ABC transporter permease [Bifidobacteriaceae bacterium]